jgi:spore germination cell wall hydrolase CwlJ-like protein
MNTQNVRLLIAGKAYQLLMAALCVWREARGESGEVQRAVAWTIRNRSNVDEGRSVAKQPPRFGGPQLAGVVTKHFQFSSFNAGDPNATKFPLESEPIGWKAWESCMREVDNVYYAGAPDPTNGATHYFDASLDNNLPTWAQQMTRTAVIGRLRFYK